MNSVDTGDKLKEIVWCDHVSVIRNPLFSAMPNVCIERGPRTYLVVEEGRIKLVCTNCMMNSTKLPPMN